MKMTALDAQHKCRRRYLALRAMSRVLETQRFEQAVTKATDAQLSQLSLILESDSIDRLRVWIKEALAFPVHMKTIRELKELARDRFIPKYSRMSRSQLIKALEK